MPIKRQKTRAVTPPGLPPGNYISEWLGHRIYPVVRLDNKRFIGREFGNCPFLAEALRQPTRCVKNENSFGVCTVNSPSNGRPQDWLACPYRVISSGLIKDACQRIFETTGRPIQPVPVTLLQSKAVLQHFKGVVSKQGAGYLFFQAKLGGEISVVSTPRSPEISFDVTLAEIRIEKGKFTVARYGILEIQTMDFHGSYRAAVQNLRDALRLHKRTFAHSLKQNLRWAAEGVEGPNIANVFKRTFYQILLKFQLSGQGAAAGTVLTIPKAVWDSWQPFLGAPELESTEKKTFRIKGAGGISAGGATNAYICVFDLDGAADSAISPVRIQMYLKVNADQLSDYAFKVVPNSMVKSLFEADSILNRIRDRLVTYWPEIAVGK